MTAKRSRYKADILISTRVMGFLAALEAKLPYNGQVMPNIRAVQRRDMGHGVCDTRSILSPREKDWVPCLAVAIPVDGAWTTLFLDKDDLEKQPAKLVKECMAIIDRSKLAEKYRVPGLVQVE